MAVGDVHVYIDETGDRGSTAKSSPIFGMAAVLADDAGAAGLQAAVNTLRADFGVPASSLLSWKAHVKNHDRRRRAAEVLAQVPGIKVCYAYATKAELQAGTYKDDQQLFYNFVAYRLYKSILWAARNWKGPGGKVWTRYSHVRHHDHTTTDAYIRRQATQDPKVPFHMEQGLKWVSATTYAESQAADLFGGFLKSALWPSGDFGYTEPAYLQSVWHQIRNSDTCAIPLGIFPMPNFESLTKLDWFPCPTCSKRPVPVSSP